jgi:probable F420-dependent oxidoreductase
MQFGIALPAQVAERTPREVLGFVDRAERLGFDSLWVLDRIAYDSFAPLPLLAAAAARTERVRLGTSILLATHRGPLVLAKDLATLDQLSGGRLTLGMAVGGRDVDFAAAFVSPRARGRRLEETIALFEQAWAGGPIDYDGEIFSIHGPPIGPRPLQEPRPPIWLGGRAPGAIARAVRLADGFIPGGSGPRGLREQIDRVDQAARAAGRDPATLAYAAVVYFNMARDVDAARATLASYLKAYYFGRLRLDIAEDTVHGAPRDAARRLAAFRDVGLHTLILVPTTSDPAEADRVAEAIALLPAGGVRRSGEEPRTHTKDRR